MTNLVSNKEIFKADFPVTIHKSYVEKAANGEENWYIEGYASTSDYDLQGDIISEEALKKSENDLLENSTVLYNHNDNRPIGRTVATKLNSQGLWIKVLISKSEPDIWQKIKEGVLNKFSIAAKVLDAAKEFVEDLGKVANIIKQMYLVEVSLVSVPANPQAKAMTWYIGKALRDYEEKGGVIDMAVTMKGHASEDAFAGTPEENHGVTGEEMVTDENAKMDNGKVAEEIETTPGATVEDLKEALSEEREEAGAVADASDSTEKPVEEKVEATATEAELKAEEEAEHTPVVEQVETIVEDVEKKVKPSMERLLRDCMSSTSLDDIKQNLSKVMEMMRNDPKDNEKVEKPAKKEEKKEEPKKSNDLTNEALIKKMVDEGVKKALSKISQEDRTTRKGLVRTEEILSGPSAEVKKATELKDPEEKLKSLLRIQRGE